MNQIMPQSEDANIVKNAIVDHCRGNWKVSMTKVLHGPLQITIRHCDVYNSLSI
jgi:hypothetical protein